MKKFICALLIVSQLCLLISCSQTEQNETATEEPDAQISIAGEDSDFEKNESETEIQPELPSIDFGGDNFVFLTRSMSGDWEAANIIDIYAENIIGEGLNDVVYNRNQFMFDNYNICIEEFKSDNCSNEITKSLAASDSSYDVAYVSVADNLNHAQRGSFLNYYTMEYVDFDQPWWDSNAEKSLSIGGKLYSAVNDIMLANNNATSAVIFNKKMWSDYGFTENPYALVRDYEWSIDKLDELSQAVCSDTDGNGIMDENDIYGFICYRDASLSLFHSSGGRIVSKNNDGALELTVMNENTYDAMIDSLTLMGSKSTFNLHKVLEQSHPNDLYTIAQNMFMSDQGLFYWILVHDIQKFRDMESDFGVLPVPSNAPENIGYGSNVNQYHGCLMSVLSTADSAQAGYVLEAMAAKSRYTIQKEYYDICLSRKYSRDNDSAEMLDIIFGNRIYDVGAYFNIANLSWDIIYLTMTDSTDIASCVRSKEKLAKKSIEKLEKEFNDLD